MLGRKRGNPEGRSSREAMTQPGQDRRGDSCPSAAGAHWHPLESGPGAFQFSYPGKG